MCVGASYGTIYANGICFNSIGHMVAKNRLVGKALISCIRKTPPHKRTDIDDKPGKSRGNLAQ